MVWSQNNLGVRVSVPVLISTHSIVPKDHQVVELQLADGRTLRASLGHPLADGRTLGILKVGDRIDHTTITLAKHVLYGELYTYDILPLGDTGFYWADGIILGSTLKK